MHFYSFLYALLWLPIQFSYTQFPPFYFVLIVPLNPHSIPLYVSIEGHCILQQRWLTGIFCCTSADVNIYEVKTRQVLVSLIVLASTKDQQGYFLWEAVLHVSLIGEWLNKCKNLN